MSFLLSALFTGLVIIAPNITEQSDDAKIKSTKTTLSTVSNMLDMYRVDSLYYPSTEQGLKVLSVPPLDAKNYPTGGYIKGGHPTDAWGNKLQYVAKDIDGPYYTLYSLGADGQKGGTGANADIYYEW